MQWVDSTGSFSESPITFLIGHWLIHNKYSQDNQKTRGFPTHNKYDS